jgi:cytochrome c-type biogenesis protein CcmH
MPRAVAPHSGAFLFGLILLLAAALPAVRASAAQRTTQAEVAQGLTCQCGCGLTVANCNHPTCEFSVPVRAEIDSMIGRGMSRVQIIAFYRHKFGEKVLSAPTTQGFNLLAWTMPFIALVLGGAFIAYTANRWRSNAPQEPAERTPVTPRESAADADRRRRLEDEIKEQI